MEFFISPVMDRGFSDRLSASKVERCSVGLFFGTVTYHGVRGGAVG